MMAPMTSKHSFQVTFKGLQAYVQSPGACAQLWHLLSVRRPHFQHNVLLQRTAIPQLRASFRILGILRHHGGWTEP